MSGSFTQVEAKTGGVGAGDFVMSVGGGPAVSAPNNVISIHVDRIDVGQRLRSVNKETVDKLYEDIAMHGLLQPIGVHHSGPAKYTIVYGLHRFLAFRKGWEEANRLGDKDPAGYRLAKMFSAIPCIVYDYDMPKAFAQLKEITENLIRQGLTKEEKAIHETKYTHLIKKLKLVVSADEKRKANASNQYKEGASHGEKHPPTATEKAVADLGTSVAGLNRSHDQVNALAKAVARDKKLKAPIKITPETPPSAEAEHTIRLAELGAINKAKAVAAGEDPRKVHPVEPQHRDEITVRVDLTDPVKVAKWFTDRVDAAGKPLTLAFLETMARELLAFVKSRREAKGGDA
jgi:hypothetical protein